MSISSNLSEILAIIQITLTALSTVPAVGTDAKLAAALISILQNGLAAYEKAAGVPLDLTKVPIETPVP